MNIQTVIRHLEVLGKIEGFESIAKCLIGDCVMNTSKVRDMDYKSYKIKIKDILLNWIYDNNLDIKYKDLNLAYFINPLFGSYTLDLVKLDVWLYNKLLGEFGYNVPDMSGMEKFKIYTNDDRNIRRWII